MRCTDNRERFKELPCSENDTDDDNPEEREIEKAKEKVF